MPSTGWRPSTRPERSSLAAAELDASEGEFLNRIVRRAFLLRAVVALILHFTGYSAILAGDEGTFEIGGNQIRLWWEGETLLPPERVARGAPALGYYYLNAAFFYVFGEYVLPLKLLNGLLGAICCRYLYRLSRAIFDRATAERATTFYAYFPSLILWSSVNIRDVWVVFFLIYISWAGLQVVRGYSGLGLLKLVIALYALSWFRDYTFFAAGLPPIIAFLIGGRGNLGRNFVLTLIAAVAVLFLYQQGVVGHRTRTSLSLEGLADLRQQMATGGSAYYENVDISTPAAALAFLPVALAYFFFSPFPWQITSFLKVLALPEMVLIYRYTPALVRGLTFAVREKFRDTLQILLMAALVTVSHALTEGNVGTLYRHRAQVVPLYLMFAAAGLRRGAERREPALGASMVGSTP